MQQRYRSQGVGIAGCLLADDMGLGKTLQSLSLISWAWQRSNSARPSLVVAPVSLLENWKLEVNKFLDWPEAAILSLYGSDLASKRSGGDVLDDDLRQLGVTKLLRPGFADGYRLVLTTYETLRDYELSIARQHWDIVVCDEAQKIKNPTAFVTQAAKALHANFKIACTGTPVENSLADLWCLFDFFQPGCLGALNEFTKVYRESIESRQEGHEALVERLRAMIQPWVLRRMKNEVHEGLPRKVMGEEADRTAVALQMSPAQRLAYMDAVAAYRQAKEQEGQGRSVSMLNLLHRLRMICAHPLAALRDDHERVHVKEHIAASPKLAWLLGRLVQIKAQGEKAIVFTDYRDLQRLLQRAIEHQFGFRPQIINGSTAVGASRGDSRQSLIDAFQAQHGFGVLILSASAVGFGVNIQEANHVIHFTRTWNPAKEDQATDRAYRIGQRRDVYVYCPTVAGPGFASFEERLAERLDYKRDLSRDMLAGAHELSVEDFDDL
jgi:SNF2 family DNA or RNA helicase